MNKLVAVILIVLIAVSLFLPASAGQGSDILAQHNEEYLKECNDVRLAVEAGMGNHYKDYIGVSPESVDFDLMYRCYKLVDEDIFNAYESNGNFKDNISSAYNWVVPRYASLNGDNGGEVRVVENNEIEFGWEIRDGVSYPSYEGINRPVFASLCERILELHPDADMSTICAVDSNNLNCRIFYFTEKGEEYILPIFFSENPDWAKSGEIYTAKEFAKNAQIADTVSAEQEAGFFKGLRNNLDYIILSGVVVIVGLVAAGIYIKKKKKTEDE